MESGRGRGENGGQRRAHMQARGAEAGHGGGTGRQEEGMGYGVGVLDQTGQQNWSQEQQKPRKGCKVWISMVRLGLFKQF